MSIHAKIEPLIVDCIIMAGQSNEAGGANMGSPSSAYLPSQPFTWIFDKNNDRSSTNNGRLENLLYGRNQNWDSAHYNTNGPEISCGYSYHSATGNPLLIIKYAQGSSGLVDDGSTINANGLWQIDADVTRANNLLHYNILVNYFIIPCIIKLKSRGIIVNIKSFHWCQGETDSVYSAMANDYQNQLTRLINQIISDLASYNVIYAGFKPIITRIRNDFVTPQRPYCETVRSAQINVADNFGGYWINSDGYTLVDNIHFVNTSQEQHGIDVCTKLLLI